MSGIAVDISSLQNLLMSFFMFAAFYDQTRSTLDNNAVEIEKLEPYFKAKEHLEIVLREKDE